jgi:hypothetical protein
MTRSVAATSIALSDFDTSVSLSGVKLTMANSANVDATITCAASNLTGAFTFEYPFLSYADATPDPTKISYQGGFNYATKWFGAGGLQVMDATIDKPSDAYGGGSANTQALKDHFVKYIASKVFGTHTKDSAFNNSSVFKNAVQSGVNASFALQSQSDMSETIFKSIYGVDPTVWTAKTSLYVDGNNNVYNIEFKDGDRIYFDLTISPDSTQAKVLNDAAATPVPDINYTICLAVTA